MHQIRASAWVDFEQGQRKRHTGLGARMARRGAVRGLRLLRLFFGAQRYLRNFTP